MSEPQLHISKEGDRYLRTLLVQGAHYILGPFGQDSDLRRWGLKLAERGGKNAKKRAVVAVARKFGRTASQVVGQRGGLRTTAKQPQSNVRSSIEGRRVWILTAELNRRDQVTATNAWPHLPSQKMGARSIIR